MDDKPKIIWGHDVELPEEDLRVLRVMRERRVKELDERMKRVRAELDEPPPQRSA